MKKVILTSITSLLIISSAYCSNIEFLNKLYSNNFVEINKKVILSNTVSISDYMAFANAYIRTYGEASNQAKLVAPNKTMQKPNSNGNDGIVGVNYMQADQYCKWLTEETNKKLQAYKAQHPNEVLPQAVFFRLPTNDEIKVFDKLQNDEMTIKKGTAISKGKLIRIYDGPEANLSYRIVAEFR
jgi:hypothetical protein